MTTAKTVVAVLCVMLGLPVLACGGCLLIGAGLSTSSQSSSSRNGPAVAAQAPPNAAEEKAPLWPHEEIETDSVPGEKFQVTLRVPLVNDEAPDADSLMAISDKIAADHPGYKRYFVSFLLPGMRLNEGSYATAHRNPDPAVSFPFGASFRPDVRERGDLEADRSALIAKLKAHESAKPSPPLYESREWQTFDKKYRTMATLAGTDGTTVDLIKPNGEHVSVPVDRLIAEDRIFAEAALETADQYRAALALWTPTKDDLEEKLTAVDARLKLSTAEEPQRAAEAEAKGKEERKREEKRVAQAKAQERLSAYAELLSAADPDGLFFGNISAKGDRLTITVTNAWHVQHYQSRLQLAQNLQKSWAAVANPSNPDKARISLVDLNGNEVGGSRILGGSLIWAAE